MMPQNHWYAACRSRDLGAAPLARTICDRPLVLFRGPNGLPAALRDYCSHRRAPLSLGQVVDGVLRCPYHGLRFDTGGQCVHIPTQKDIPAAAHIPAWPVTERYGFVWVWIGDAARADLGLVPALPWREEAGWDTEIIQYFPVRAGWMLMNDNLLDLSHVAFIHANTIGFDPGALADDPLVTESAGGLIRNTRVFRDVVPPPVHRAWHDWPGRVTRTSISEWRPPACVTILVRNEDATTKLDLRIDHCMTPATATTHHYFVAIARNFQVGNAVFGARLDDGNERVHREDLAMVEAQQRVIDATPGHFDMLLTQDGALRSAHRILKKLADSSPPP